MAARATVTETPLLGLGFSQMETSKSLANALPLAMKVSSSFDAFSLMHVTCEHCFLDDAYVSYMRQE